MTIAKGRDIIGSDVEALITANYPDLDTLYGLIPPSHLRKKPFDASGHLGLGGSQGLATSCALICLGGLPIRSKGTQTVGGIVYDWDSDGLATAEVQGTRVRAANFWQTVQARGSSQAAAQAAATALLDPAATMLGQLAAFYVDNSPFGGFLTLSGDVRYFDSGFLQATHTITLSYNNASFTDSFTFASGATLTVDVTQSGNSLSCLSTVSNYTSIGGIPNPDTTAGFPHVGIWSGTATGGGHFSINVDNTIVGVGTKNAWLCILFFAGEK